MNGVEGLDALIDELLRLVTVVVEFANLAFGFGVVTAASKVSVGEYHVGDIYVVGAPARTSTSSATAPRPARSCSCPTSNRRLAAR